MWRRTASDMVMLLSPPDLTLVETRTVAASVKAVRTAEWIIFAFLVYAPALAFFMPTSAGLRTWLALLNLLVIVCYATRSGSVLRSGACSWK